VLLHTRNLYDFLTGHPTPQDHVLASHFIADSGSWTAPELSTIKSCKRDINKARSHITYARVRLKRTWPFAEFLEEIERGFLHFIAALPESERPLWETQP
jgi:hypothetical protein